LVVRNAATRTTRRTLRIVVTVHARSLALATGTSGAIAVPRAAVALHLACLKLHSHQSMAAQIAPTMMATLRLTRAMSIRAQLIVKDHGAPGLNAPNNAPTARAMVPLAPSLAHSLSLSKLNTVANSAPLLITRRKRRSAMTNAAQWIAWDHGTSSLNALHPAEMESRVAPTASPSQLCMVVRNALAVTSPPTLLHATSEHAQSIVQASGQLTLIAPRSAVVVRRHPGT
jgi:hypothetical protein